MRALRHGALPALAAMLVHAAGAQPTQPAPSFDVAYRAWEVVTELARHHAEPTLGGACGKTFRPFVIPGLRRQTRQEEDAAALACVAAARAACADGRWRRNAAIARKCEEFSR